MTNSRDDFDAAIENVDYSGNVDIPEDGLTALLQAVGCKNMNDKTMGINWEDSKFKMIIFSSDAPVKVAGDGIFAGLIEPNDGNCYMDGNRYTKEKEFDYPTIGTRM